ncbi:MAG: hypothetical protein ACC700_19875, partial [Anaerolineales bacterium]
MSARTNRIRTWLGHEWFHPLVLLVVAILAFGLLIPWLGFYWDDWPKAWFLHNLGPSGFHDVYGADRPNLAWTYLLTTTLLGENPIAWQIFGLLTRWLSAVALWWMLKELWPKRPGVAELASLVFLVFPGFSQQYISLIYSHFLLIQAIHLFSLAAMVHAIRRPRHRVLWTLVSIAGALYSLLSIEYYVGLELLRPLLIYWTVGENTGDFKSRLKTTLRYWVPYIPILPIFLVWRTQIIGYPTYEPTLLNRVLDQPLTDTVEELGRLLFHDLVEAAVGSWVRLVPLPSPQSFGLISTSLVAGVWIVVSILVGAYLYFRLKSREGEPTQDLGGTKFAAIVLGTGVWALLAAGWPFWLTDLPLKPFFPNDRFMLAFLVGGSLVAVGLVMALGVSRRARYVAIAFLAVLIGLGAGQQVRYATEFRRERDAQSDLLWQFMWRVPGLEPGTTIMMNELPLKYDDDEAITAAVNWIYGDNDVPGEMAYLVVDVKLRLGKSFASLDEDVDIHKDYRATSFDGSTSQVIVMSYDPPKCLRVFDVVLHDSLPGIPEPLPSAIPLSRLELIQPEPARAANPPLNVLGPEPPYQWCYYFQKADLARQQGDWEQIARLGDIAFALEDRPNDA